MKHLQNELLARFPEILEQIKEGDEDLPYLTMGYLLEWLDAKGQDGFDMKTVQRLIDFSKWCESQPRGKTASDDIWTIFTVTLLEGLFLRDHTRSLIPKITSLEVIQQCKEYLISWVGEENYEKALQQF